ncbi:UNVERIFIED_CONTAM: hypothetical protein PYX00_005881 [Menopon gallinae]|uniref:Secreted protein n=1 Tax=Menopon gallinae TaxID=328185 RepID=A0AAW2HTT6_9NEOP
MHLIPRMATALVFFIYIGEEGLNAQLLTRRYQTPKQLCGAALSNELQLVCEGEYNSMIKKSEDRVAARSHSTLQTSFDEESEV